ncbi:MAG: addiction module toxin RelE [Tannerella sp.]|nr:addiction module toxin RelE [Tannerella sp.]
MYKKFPSLSSDYQKFETSFSENPQLGVDLGDGFRKVRIAIQSKNKGKSGGGIITYDMFVKQQENVIILVDIYDKNEKETLSEKKYTDILKRFLENEQDTFE